MFDVEVLMVMGITDIDDKIINRANEVSFYRNCTNLVSRTNLKLCSDDDAAALFVFDVQRSVDFQTLAKHFEKRFFEDMARLNVAPPMVKLRVSDHIPHIISFVQRLIDKGIAYVVPSGQRNYDSFLRRNNGGFFLCVVYAFFETFRSGALFRCLANQPGNIICLFAGSVYFDLKKYGKPGKLLTEVEQETNKPTDNKRSVSDFAVWKAKKAGNPFWDSPWGPGRPGWHIECSAMAR